MGLEAGAREGPEAEDGEAVIEVQLEDGVGFVWSASNVVRNPINQVLCLKLSIHIDLLVFLPRVKVKFKANNTLLSL